MDVRAARLRTGEWLTGAGVVVMVVALFALHWYGRSGTTPAQTGWGGTTHVNWLLLVTIVVALALVVAQAAFRAPAIPACLSVISTVVALVAALWLLLRVVIDPASHQRAGAWIELLGGLVVLVGSFLSLRKEGIAERDGPGEIPTASLARARGA